MPWCPVCERYLAPPSVTPGGACPRCGRAVDVEGSPASATTGPGAEPLPPIPWHLKLLALAVAAYLLLRLVQGAAWIEAHL